MSGMPRHDFFQTEEFVTLTILKRGANLDGTVITYNDRDLVVKVDGVPIFEGKLFGSVNKDDFAVTCTPSKVEIRMPKSSHGRWTTLLEVNAAPSRPITFVSKNWDALEKQAVEEEENEELEGDAAVNKMFQKIYKDSSDEVKKAMIKSYSESNGTVLSTNWSEIKEKRTEVKPPDCMEFKKFDQ